MQQHRQMTVSIAWALSRLFATHRPHRAPCDAPTARCAGRSAGHSSRAGGSTDRSAATMQMVRTRSQAPTGTQKTNQTRAARVPSDGYRRARASKQRVLSSQRARPPPTETVEWAAEKSAAVELWKESLWRSRWQTRYRKVERMAVVAEKRKHAAAMAVWVNQQPSYYRPTVCWRPPPPMPPVPHAGAGSARPWRPKRAVRRREDARVNQPL